MTPSSCASSRMEAMRADSTMSGKLDHPCKRLLAKPKEYGCLEAASAAGGQCRSAMGWYAVLV